MTRLAEMEFRGFGIGDLGPDRAGAEVDEVGSTELAPRIAMAGAEVNDMQPRAIRNAVREPDFVAVAERFVGTPYLWGGKSSLGIDCSGLVQVALTAAGIPCPRDSDMQERALGKPASLAGLQSGDLIFWKGHVAIARGRNSMIHANAFHMAVAIEPVAEALARIGAAGSQVTSVRRLK